VARFNPAAIAHLRVRVPRVQSDALRDLAGRRRASISQVLRQLISDELEAGDEERSALPEEAAIRDMAILIAVELVLKLQETSIPGGATLSRRLLEAAAAAAIERLETVGRSLRREVEA
jgi:hypothetical protein